MNPFGTRGASELAAALDGGAAVVPGIALAARLRSTGAALDAVVAPRAEFRDALRMRLMAVATVQAAAPAQAAPRALESAVSWRRRSGAVAAGAMASVVAVSGVAVAGSQSLPGDPFYGVKRTAEAFQLRAADGAVEEGSRHLDFAATRLREVRGLTLGRDAADAGPELGPAAMGGGITLRSAAQPLASGEALGADVAARVKQTLAAMDEQTKKGSALLTDAYRDSRADEPLRVLSRFTSRQTAGLEQLLPALPPVTQDRARISLALLTGVNDQTQELLSIGTCGAGCDPTQAAPTLPATPGASGSTGTPSCDCAAPAPAPAPQATPVAQPTGAPQGSGQPEPEPTPAPSSEPTEPAPAPSPTSSQGGLPVPVPTLPIPVPTLPVPIPTLTLPPPLAPAVDAVLPGLSGKSTQSDDLPLPASAPAPVAQLAPLPPRS